MILVVSRFRVANRLEHAVADAFAHRPRLVDSWPGFLGLETFTDTADATVFYLVTRWTNREAFRDWHGSAVHRESHKWIPKGLRLDPSYTQVLELERLTEGRDREMSGLALDANPMIAMYFERTRFVHVLRFDLAGEIEFANEMMTARLGAAGSSLRGRSVFEYLTEHDATLLKQQLDARKSSVEPVNLNFCDAEGLPFTLSSLMAAYPDGCLLIGEPAYDDEQRLQRQLLEVNEELASLARNRQRSTLVEQKARLQAEGANRAKDHALAVIAHELRQPLSAAVAALGVLKQNPAGAARAQVILERQIKQMTGLVEDLLNASSVMQGAIELKRESVDLRPIVQEAVDLTKLVARERRQKVTLVTPDEPLNVLVDVNRMRQVFVNIITNATKYTPDAGSIVVSVEPSDEGAGRVSVRDTGQGIEATELDAIFGLFVRATSGGNGLGIGLAVAKRLVEVHDGTITAHSQGVGRGSEFIVTLPVVKPLHAS